MCPFPPGWGRLQNPLHHIKSYTQQEHGRWAQIIAPMLRVWVRKTHIRDTILAGIKKVFAVDIVRLAPRLPPGMDHSIDMLIQIFTFLAVSNRVHLTPNLAVQDRQSFVIATKTARKYWQMDAS